MQGGRIVVLIDHLGNSSKGKTGGTFECFRFQLPDPVHEDIAGAHGCADESACTSLALNFERPARVTDQDAIPRELVLGGCLREAAEHANAEVIEYTAIGVRMPAEFSALCSDI